ncbi:hypothetical protein C8K38_111238 [Rhodococcus sp. OK611]|uniref:hypothetical protein n=1 Tax=unclassified Rhodococcus (in: high G+C Gram-positive bacteria) TaxID=192944 RepID=UPI000BD5E5F9|nr:MULTISPECIES: hypothetical protein [unclassified Rhodococcus (in: high G+C Gram-positive bacteria)]PTR42069.1 hypothetical protein C8K38_111238 [Rhodococcus sp. OK611]SNX91484.1 hypothetical protein SAMN05447004_11019 [Rhodococcus sp. OK270]
MSGRLIHAEDVADELGVPAPVLAIAMLRGVLPYVETADGPHIDSVELDTFRAGHRMYECCPGHWVCELQPEQPESAERLGVGALFVAAAAVLTLGLTAGAWLIQLVTP